ncbi:MAG TPA: Spy/CpxP family protein refolding chaperone [Candidatus Kapabacteria bacterium]|nr:Spy/CpxP family protein refolding chaperone [Candidatus Kapabacteria bacterium]
MRIKTLLLALLFGSSLALASIASAQTTAPPVMLTPQQKMEKRLAHVTKALKLTDAQADQLKSIWEQNASKLEADRAAIQAASKGTDARKDAVKALVTDRKGMMQQMKGVLTPEQLKKFKRLMLRNVERREKRLKHIEQKLKQ